MTFSRCARLLLATAGICTTTVSSGEEFTGYIGVDFGPDYEEAHDDTGFDEAGPGAWAAAYGRLGIDLADDITMQFDAWLRRGEGNIDGDATYSWEQTQAGVAAHLTYRNGNFLGGAAGSLGLFNGNNDWKSTFGTVAVEGGFDADEFMVIGQLGYTGPLSGNGKDLNHEIAFAALDATYYLNPDLSVSAQVSWSRYTSDGDADNDKDITALVATVEYKLPETPVILAASYLLEHYDYVNISNDFYQLNQRLTVGARIPFGEGSTTLRDLDRATGLEHPAGYYNR